MAQVISIIAFLLATVMAPLLAMAELPRLKHSPHAYGSLNVLAVGDWGRRRELNQTLVAKQV